MARFRSRHRVATEPETASNFRQAAVTKPRAGRPAMDEKDKHGGGRRIAALTDWLLSKSPSAVVATEWRNNAPGQYLRNRLTLGGLESLLAAPATSQINTVLLAAKRIMGSQAATPLNLPVGDLVSISMEEGVSILGCYFPQRMDKAPFFTVVLNWRSVIRINHLS